MDDWFPVQVKQKGKAGRPDIDSFEAVMNREDRTHSVFRAFDFTADAERETRKFLQREGREMRLLKVADLIEMDHARMVTKKPPASVRPAEQGELGFSVKKSAGSMSRARRQESILTS